MPIKNHSSKGQDISQMDAVVFGLHPVVRTVDDLDKPQPQKQYGEDEHDQGVHLIESPIEYFE